MGGFGALDRGLSEAWAFLISPGGLGLLQGLLVATFLVSAIVKIRRPLPAAMAMADFGLLAHPRRWQGTVLGLTELLVALSLGFSWWGRFLAFPAALLLGAFLSVMINSLSKGRRFSCSCFGDSQSVLSWWSALRTAALAVAATILALGTTSGRIPPDPLSPIEAVGGAGIVAVGFLLGVVRPLLSWNSSVRRFAQ